MGHLHAKNLSKIMLNQLYMRHFDVVYDEHGDVLYWSTAKIEPQPIKIEDFVQYFFTRVTTIRDVVEKIPQSWGKKLIINLVEQAYGVNASEGTYLDDGMLKMAIKEIIAIWKDPKSFNIEVVKGDDTIGYWLNQAMLSTLITKNLDMYIVKEIEL